VDLDCIERETPQIAERRVAGPEVVESDVDPDLVELMKTAEYEFTLAQQRRLGDFQFEPVRGEPGSGEGRNDAVSELTAIGLDRGNVHRDAHRVRPRGSGRTGFAQHPFPNGRDQLRLLGDRDEFARQDKATLWTMPAQECFKGCDRGGGEVENRL